MLREVLAGQQGLRLISLQNLPPMSLSEAAVAATSAAGAAAESPGGIDPKDRGPFLHPVEIVVEGDYASIVAYLHSLESLPYELHWDRVELDARDYPNNRVRIVVGPLSLSRQWITV
jgi:MSHA biogenesis protein MshJ